MHILYVGVAAPLVEVSDLWLLRLAPLKPTSEERAALVAFLREEVRAYGLEWLEPAALAFETAPGNPDSIKARVRARAATEPQLVEPLHQKVVAPLDHKRAVAEVKRKLGQTSYATVVRTGLTMQQLQEDMARLRPSIVVLNCHGTAEGCLLLEDGLGGADVVGGERLGPVLQPLPPVLFLSACHSHAAVERLEPAIAGKALAVVSVRDEAPVEVAACSTFEGVFFTRLSQGATANEAFAAARLALENDPDLAGAGTDPGKLTPADKFDLNKAGEAVKLPELAGAPAVVPDEPTRPRVRSSLYIRKPEHFVGRQREMAGILRALLPPRAGLRPLALPENRRAITLTKEGGIGKTALLSALADWAEERGVFPGGMYELSCETLSQPAQLLTQLLAMFGVPPEHQQGDLHELLAAAIPRVIPAGQPALLVIDNLDDLCGLQAPPPVRQETLRVLETCLGFAPALRLLATSRWPLGLRDFEHELEVPPMQAEEAGQVFLAYTDDPAHRFRVFKTLGDPNSPVRQLIELVGGHPHSLFLLARQLRRKGLTLEQLLDEARADLMRVLRDPQAGDADTDRRTRAGISFGVSFRHLSPPGKVLFQRMALLPGGVWCAPMVDKLLAWEPLLGDDWREVMERELDYFALVHFEREPGDAAGGVFSMLPSMREFALQHFKQSNDAQWERRLAAFWAAHLARWARLLSGRFLEGDEPAAEKRAQANRELQRLAVALFARTQPNWSLALRRATTTDLELAKRMLLDLVSFCDLAGQRVLLRDLSREAVAAARSGGHHEQLAPLLVTLGSVLRELGEREAARSHLEEALPIYRRLAQAHPAAFEPNVGATLNNLGNVLFALGEREAARRSFEEALQILRRLAQAHPAAFEPDVATTLNNLGNVLLELGEREAARRSLEEALPIYRRLAGASPAAFEPGLAMALNNLGNLLRDLGEREAARSRLEEALPIYRRLALVHPAAFEPDLAAALNNLGNVLGHLGEREAARRSFEEALLIYRRLALAHPAAFEPDVAMTLNNLGVLLGELGQREAARRSFEEALRIYFAKAEQSPAAFSQKLSIVLRNYVRVTPEKPDDPWWQIWRQLNKDGSG